MSCTFPGGHNTNMVIVTIIINNHNDNRKGLGLGALGGSGHVEIGLRWIVIRVLISAPIPRLASLEPPLPNNDLLFDMLKA